MSEEALLSDGLSVVLHLFLLALTLVLYFTCEWEAKWEKQTLQGKGPVASRRADDNLHMKAMAEKSLCPMVWLENGCVGKQFWKEGRVLCWGRTAETCVRAVVTIKPWAGFHLLSFEPKQIPSLNVPSPLKDWEKR